MNKNGNDTERPNTDRVLAGLKDFQQKTVHYVFRRLYEDPDAVSRFLIADEVGLGKTLVARGLIARAVDYLWDKTDRIDIIYICSNQEIAQQNIDRLNIAQTRTFQLASRATLLPITLNQLRGNKLNFVSLTPGTSFNLRSSTGWVYERVLLYHLIRKVWDVSDAALVNVLRVDVKRETWASWDNYFRKENKIDEDLENKFLAELSRNPELSRQFAELVREVGGRRKYTPDELKWERNRLIGQFRELLARSSLSALEPDLVILDEFQRFKDLLNPDNPLSSLANTLFSFPNVKVLLLSATPYKMYTLHGEEGEDHYQDFNRTSKFLLESLPGKYEDLTRSIEGYRKAMFRIALPESREELRSARFEIEQVLRKVMVRTERLAATEDRNGMLTETRFGQNSLRPADLQSFTNLDKIAGLLEAGDQVEYWKSAAYPLNLMDSYNLKRRLRKAIEDGKNKDLIHSIKNASGSLLKWEQILSYQPVDPANGRLRSLVSETIDTENWRLLWMPAAFPYYAPVGAFATVRPDGYTKTLIFSSWQVVPKTIAMMLSYEAERRIIGGKAKEYVYDQLTVKRGPLIRFALTQGRPANLSNFCMLYPCLTLATRMDPLAIANNISMAGGTPTAEEVVQALEAMIETLLNEASQGIEIDSTIANDETWYWAAPLLLDRYFENQVAEKWLSSQDENLDWVRMLEKEKDDRPGEEDTNRFADHVRELQSFFQNPQILGAKPKDLIQILARMALASPVICSLRAFLRRIDGVPSAHFLAAAAQAGMGFRTLYNQPESILLIQEQFADLDYWKAILQYGMEGNLQAVLDEYVHILYEALGQVGHPAEESVMKIGQKIRAVLSIRAPLLRFDEFVMEDHQPIHLEVRRIRCRYALRIGEDVTEEIDSRTRAADVREAFNSPFRPFVLASTSIGQEGLDFHQYCHRIVHWNLPSNPVDLEQREGRIHRYKGHVIRRNIASSFTFNDLHLGTNNLVDIWKRFFDLAIKNRVEGANDLIPFWIYEHGEHKIERRLPILPLSRENMQIDDLKRAMVIYRSLIGQPRQEDLMKLLQDQGAERIQDLLADSSIDLRPT